MIDERRLLNEIDKLPYQVEMSREVKKTRPFIDIANVIECINNQPKYNEQAGIKDKLLNGGNIRSMTDEQLARFLIGFKNTFGEEYEGEMSCLDWLRSEVDAVSDRL